MKPIVKLSVFAGILIGLGSAGFLALGGIPGAVIFSFGLVGVVLSGSYLYTGKAGVITNIYELTEIWFFNILACAAIGFLILYLGGEPVTRAKSLVTARLNQDILRVFIKAIGCGVIIDISCFLYRKSDSLVPILLGVPLFILCGFYHSIADVVYLCAAGIWDNDILWYYPTIALGNYLGCNIRRIINIC